MKPLISLIILLTIPITHFGQRFQKDTSENKIRNVIWTIPVRRNTTINGLAVGFFPVPSGKAQSLKINGVSISASPLEPFIGVMAIGVSLGELFTILESPFTRKKVRSESSVNEFFNITPLDTNRSVVLNGLIVGGVTGRGRVNGANITAVGNAASEMHGLSISGLFNVHHSFKGVIIAGLRNKVYRGNGFQIGLINQCVEGRVIQIGLINKLGKRILPILNFRL
jgi:hypothetical protein